MLLSVVLVNYKVPQLTIEAVRSVLAGCRLIEGEVEVIVLDNASSDDSMGRLRTAFGAEPRVKLLESATNGGFARGNNQAIAEAQGDYLLLLNPDTLVGESTLAYCLTFLRTHPEAGAVGPRLINQSGAMHPECKRGVPTLWHSFCRFTRLYRLAPHSAWLNGYYQGHLSPDEVQQVPVLTGAFLMMRRTLYQAVGGLDERYFMYGEDIDLCYTIERAGYHNYYLPTPVLHYKGESEQAADRVRYEENFYGAMRLFYLKHQGESWWSRHVTTPLVLAAINVQRHLALCRRKTRASQPAPHTVSLTLAELSTDIEAFPQGTRLEVSLAGASYDALLETMERCAERRYLFIVNP
ncbi:glycosyltransferase family 2 protein [uncultured Porphyromonas sp.]|uniref:glycosyltransferase family 2 protein n=1 Tax=uncultured Porphyromonas sp. TaxID=159274 RepID=UPI00262248DD|nr:glycosyltransferase family 2 protein [uncultured Porphyromonas sp.]